jgi:ribosomal-protein-alanine N-acetyltransferase
MPGPRLVDGDNVTLRTVERDDARFIQRAWTDPDIRYPLGNAVHRNQHSVEALYEGFIENDSNAQYLVCLDTDEAGPGHPSEAETTPIGAVAATGVDSARPELSYWLVPDHHGERYGSEAVSLVLDTLFRTYNIPGGQRLDGRPERGVAGAVGGTRLPA